MTAYFYLRLYTKLAWKATWQLVNRKADFLQNESILIDSHNESNRFESRIGMLYAVLAARGRIAAATCRITPRLTSTSQWAETWHNGLDLGLPGPDLQNIFRFIIRFRPIPRISRTVYRYFWAYPFLLFSSFFPTFFSFWFRAVG